MYVCIYVANESEVVTEQTTMKLMTCEGLLMPGGGDDWSSKI